MSDDAIISPDTRRLERLPPRQALTRKWPVLHAGETPHYPDLANAANHTIAGGVRVFAGQREDPFFVDLGSIFDLAALRPIQSLHLIPLPNAPGVNTLRNLNVHTIAIQVPISMLTRHRNRPTDVADPGERYDVLRYQQDARAALSEADQRALRDILARAAAHLRPAD